MKLTFSLLGFLAVAAGILAAIGIGWCSTYWLLGGLALVTLGFIRFILKHQLNGWIIFLCFFICGGFWFSLSREGYWSQLKINQSFSGRVLSLEGIQVECAVPTRYGYRFNFQIRESKGRGPVGYISVISRIPIPSEYYGRNLRIGGKFKEIPGVAEGIPGFFEKQHIVGMIFITERPEILPGNGLPAPYLWAHWIRESLIRQGDKVLKPDNAKLLHGMIFNDVLSDSSNAGIVTDMQRTGTIHLLSVSGLHIGFIVFGMNLFLQLLRFPRKWRVVPLTATVWFYILMTGLNPPVLRAGVMMLLLFLGEVVGSRDNNVNRLSLAALLLILFNPYNLFEIGFQLSFLGTLGVVWIYPLLKEYLPLSSKFNPVLPIVKPIWQGILVSIGAQSLIIPVIILFFQIISWSSPLVNIILLIPAEFIVVGGFVGEILGTFVPRLGWIILTGIGWMIDLVRYILDIFAGLPCSFSWVPSWPWPWVAGYYLALVILLDWLRPNRLTKNRVMNAGTIIIIGLFVLNAVVWFIYLEKKVSSNFQLSCLDVGQGDAILLRTPDGFTALIDSGDVTKGDRYILPFLRQRGVYQLDLAIATHGHQDHLGGLAEVLAEIPVRKLLLPPHKNHYLKVFLRKLKTKKIKHIDAVDGLSVKLGKSVTAKIFNISDPESENNQSLVILIHYRKNKFLLTGDLGFRGEEILVRKHPDLLHVSVLKVAHHGSNQASSLLFLTQVRPKVALISVGIENRFGHPGRKTLERLNSLGIRTYRTDRNGRIDLRTDGEKLMVFTQK